jgi:thiol:disulfide interchange protein DsbD
MGVKVSVFSRGWATVQSWGLGLGLGLGLSALLLAPLPGHAQTGPLFSTKGTPASTSGTSALLGGANHVVKTDQVRAELLVHAPQGIQAGKTFWLGLQIEHQPDWHTYWQNPGDSGLPTRLQWQLPAGLQAGDIAWPLPKKFPIGTLANYGYEGRLLLTVPVTVGADFRFPDTGPLALVLQAEWLVCRQECIPQEGRFSLNLASAATQIPHAASFESAQKLSPKPMAQLQQGGTWITGGQATLSADARQITLRVHGLPVNWRGQTLRILVGGAAHAQNFGLVVHELNKTLHTSGHTFGQSHRRIVTRLDNHAFDQILHRDAHLRVNEHAGAGHTPSSLGDRQNLLAVELATLDRIEHQISRHQLGQRCGFDLHIGIFSGEYLIGRHIHQ